MTKQELLVDFLKEHKCYDKYRRLWKDTRPGLLNVSFKTWCKTTNIEDLIAAAFVWSVDNFYYWAKVNAEWIKHIKIKAENEKSN